MIIAKIRVNGVIAKIVYRKVIPAGIIGAQVELDYDEDIWHGLHKTVVFKGAVTKDVITDANIVTIPHEVVGKPFFRLSIGVYGVDADGNIAIPTLWEDIGAILDAAAPSGDISTDPSLPVWAQIQAMNGNLDDLTTEAKNNLVAAVNEVKHTADSKQDTISDLKAIRSGAAKGATALQSVPSTYRTAAAQNVIDAKKQDTLIQSGASVGQIVKISAVDDTGKPTAWEAINIPEQAQPDWNQNDNTQPDYVKNRPFYTRIRTRTVTVETVPAEDAELEGFPVFAVGDTVTVNVDSVEHSLVAYDDAGYDTIGDTTHSLNSGEGQFGWQIYVEEDGVVWFSAKEAHTVSYVVEEEEEVVKIDEKYLPDSVVDTNAYQVRIEKRETSGKWTLTRGTYDEIYEKLQRGTPINVEIVNYGIAVQYFYHVGRIYYNFDNDCIEILTIYIQGTTTLKIAEFDVKAGGTVSDFYYNLQQNYNVNS